MSWYVYNPDKNRCGFLAHGWFAQLMQEKRISPGRRMWEKKIESAEEFETIQNARAALGMAQMWERQHGRQVYPVVDDHEDANCRLVGWELQK